jgi:hypothetical protein
MSYIGSKLDVVPATITLVYSLGIRRMVSLNRFSTFLVGNCLALLDFVIATLLLIRKTTAPSSKVAG